MKPSLVQFKKSVKVIQVFRNSVVYGKEGKSLEHRQGKLDWKPYSCRNGYIKKGDLFLEEGITALKDFEQSDLIILTDGLEQRETIVFSSTLKGFLPGNNRLIYIFKIKDNFDLNLRYEHFEIGIPHRDNFKLGTIEKGKPLEIKINGKIDFSLTAGRARMFMDQMYIIEYLGDFKRARLLKYPIIPFSKSIPKNRKVIDLLKPLW